GIMTDTGSFQFPSTDARALERAARLRAAGADLQAITYNIFRNKRFEAIRLWGLAFSRLVRERNGQLVWTEVRASDLDESGARDEDISGIVEQIARSSGMRVAILFNEQEGVVKVSCRTSQWEPSVDAAALMGGFGGGGHVGAATKFEPRMREATKVYDAVVRFGRETATDDREGESVREADVPPLDGSTIERGLATLRGVIEQTPPRYSALKIAGRPAYARA